MTAKRDLVQQRAAFDLACNGSIESCTAVMNSDETERH